ncbi:unnamed protein product [Absidia cylindrospora]
MHFTKENQEGSDCSAEYTIGNVNISASFRAFRTHVLENVESYLNVDEHFNQLLALSHILVGQNRTRYESILPVYFDSTTLQSIYDYVADKHSFYRTLDEDLGSSIRRVLKVQ